KPASVNTPRSRVLSVRPVGPRVEVDDRSGRPSGNPGPQERLVRCLVAGVATAQRLLVRLLEIRAIAGGDRAFELFQWAVLEGLKNTFQLDVVAQVIFPNRNPPHGPAQVGSGLIQVEFGQQPVFGGPGKP